MKSSVIIGFFLFFINPVVAQDTAYEDSFNALYAKVEQYAYTHKDSAYSYLRKTYALTTSQNDWENAFWLLVQWNESTAYFYDLKTFKDNLTALDSLVSAYRTEINSAPGSQEFKIAPIYYNGLYDFELQNYERSRISFGTVINFIEKSPDSLNTAFQLDLLRAAYSFMAKMNFNEGKYELAKEFYGKNILFLKEKIPDDKENLFRNYSLLAEVYKAEGNHRVSNVFFIRSLKYNIQNQTSINSIITETDHIIENYINLSQPDSAKYYLAVLKENLPKNHPFQHKYHQASAKILISENRPEEALSALELALTEIRRKWDLKKHVEVAMANMEIGDLQTKWGHYKQALVNYKLALGQLETFNSTERLKLLKSKSVALTHLKTDFHNAEALKAVDLGIAVLDTLKPGFTSTQDKLVLIDDAFPLFEAGIEAAFAKYGLTHEHQYLEKAFYYMEKGKSTLLLDALLNAKAIRFAGVPQKLLENEQQLKAEIADAEKKIALQDQDGPELREALFRLKKRHRELIHRLGADYPRYFALRYDTHVVTLDQVRGQLEKDQLMISYFYGDQNIYALVISKGSVYFIRIRTTPLLDKGIKGYVKMLGNPKSAIDSLSLQGSFLYSVLVKPLLSGTSAKRLIIIPDGPLNYLPFSSLNTNADGSDYLIEKFTVSYTNSATLLHALKAKSDTENKLLAFAPGFDTPGKTADGTMAGLTPLPSSIKEVRGIAPYFPEDTYLGDEATLTNFKSRVSSHSMIHLATHALADNKSPEYSFLAFSPLEKEHLLYLRDLYDMQIPADLVTLSACETGIGPLKRGEGMISLSRAFFYSGAKSLVNTLWAVNDNSSSAIMSGFYKNLSQRMPKDRALRRAKLDFVNKHREDKLSHPYYWSSFVVNGNTSPVTVNSILWWVIGSIAPIIIVGGFIFYRKRRKRILSRIIKNDSVMAQI